MKNIQILFNIFSFTKLFKRSKKDFNNTKKQGLPVNKTTTYKLVHIDMLALKHVAYILA